MSSLGFADQFLPFWILTKVLESPQSIEVDKRPDMKFRQGFTEAGAAVQGSKNKKWLPLLAPWILK